MKRQRTASSPRSPRSRPISRRTATSRANTSPKPTSAPSSTLIRFDAAYHGAFKCNIRRLADYPNLSGYVREIYQWPGMRETVKIDQIKRGYYSIAHINPTKIVPLGPELDFDAPHGRDALAGKGVWIRG